MGIYQRFKLRDYIIMNVKIMDEKLIAQNLEGTGRCLIEFLYGILLMWAEKDHEHVRIDVSTENQIEHFPSTCLEY